MKKRHKVNTGKTSRKTRKPKPFSLFVSEPSALVITQDERFADKLNKNKIPCALLEGLSQWTDESVHIHDEMEQIRWQGRMVFLIPSILDGKVGLEKLVAFAKRELVGRGARCFIPGFGILEL